ncbi:hypothetical protein PP187_gp138 [Klebsiella phage vB_KvM-Eowyn]|uniref:Uncharacterized protein n=1 Tax=Klebsiella phage vB_KvM-Eowyn TaxID=2762819 RepID=A0A7R8MJF9_9CAUD|nr:hypothetical protein PP187_gp138 [Klebsiella phage vB_KvM-Eowyn]CAD5236127.1 hypothetical protein LLCLJKAH_00138 [Klebsiella phage vB_KvM-Eowyn]
MNASLASNLKKLVSSFLEGKPISARRTWIVVNDLRLIYLNPKKARQALKEHSGLDESQFLSFCSDLVQVMVNNPGQPDSQTSTVKKSDLAFFCRMSQ